MNLPQGQNEVELAVAGDRASLEALMSRHGLPLMRRIEAKIPADLHAAASADDILQETFVQVYRDISRLQARDEDGFAAWMGRIAEHRLLDLIRKLHRRKRDRRLERQIDQGSLQVLLVDLLEQDRETASQMAATAEAAQAIQISLAGLPEDQREAIQLRFLQQHSLEQAAQIMQRSPAAVRGLVHRAKQAMRESLGRSTVWFPKLK